MHSISSPPNVPGARPEVTPLTSPLTCVNGYHVLNVVLMRHSCQSGVKKGQYPLHNNNHH